LRSVRVGVAAILGEGVGMHFDADYREQVTLRDGRVVVLRLVRPEDKELLRSGFERWSPESRYRRFFSVKTELSDDELRYLTELDGVRHFALGAVTAAGDDGLGIARYICLADEPGVAEAAIAVADHAQGVGLGSLLFQRLVAAAAERGVERFRCEMLAANASMAELVRSLAPTVSIEIASGVMRMEFTLPNVGPTHPHDAPPRDNGLYRLLALAAKGAIELVARWQALGARLTLGLLDREVPTPPQPEVVETAAAASDDE
jgi:GNAT superfamily N-acetyltransferase